MIDRPTVLKPCPFCGAQVELKHSHVEGEDDWIEHVAKVGGNNCALRYNGFYLDGDLVTAWNTRAI